MTTRNWNPSPADAMSLAAIRWFACTLEALAIELYATDRTTYPRIEQILRDALKELNATPVKGILHDEDCPDGYVRCGDVCRPACVGGFAEAGNKGAARAATSPTKRRRS